MQTHQWDTDQVQRIVFGLVVAYFVVWIAAIALESAALSLLSAAFFGVIAIAIGVLLSTQFGEADTVSTVAAVLLGVGGLLQLLWVGSVIVANPLSGADDLAEVLVLVGIVAYVYVIWGSD